MSTTNRSHNWVRVGLGVVVVAVMATTGSTALAKSRSMLTPVKARTAAGGSNLAAGQVLGGFTSQGWPVVLELSKDGKQIALAGIGLSMNCSSGAQFSTGDGWIHAPIAAGGKVREAAQITPAPKYSLTGGSDSFTGKLNRRQVAFSGTWQLHLTYSMSNGQTDQCDSGRVAFSARL